MKTNHTIIWIILCIVLVTTHKSFAGNPRLEAALSTYNYARTTISKETARELYKEALSAFEDIYINMPLEESEKIETLTHIITCRTTLKTDFSYGAEEDILDCLNELILISDRPYESIQTHLFCCKVCTEFDDITQALRFYELAVDAQKRHKIRDSRLDLLFTEALGLIEIHNNRELKGIRYLKKASNMAKKAYGKGSEEYLSGLLEISKEYSRISAFTKSSRYHTLAHKPYTESVRKQFSQCTEVQRTNYWNSAYHYFAKTNEISYQFAKGHSNKKKISKTAYNSNLLSKSILLTTSKDYDDYLSNQTDSTIASMSELRKSSTSLDDSINTLITQRLEEMGIPYSSPHLDLTWKDVRRNLRDDDLAIEFFKTKGNYGALLLKKHWDSPKCITLGRIEFPDEQSSGYSKMKRWELSKAIWSNQILRHFPRKEDATVYFAPDAEMHLFGIEYLPLFFEASDTSFNSISDYFKIRRLTSTRSIALGKINEANIESAALYGAADFTIPAHKLDKTKKEICTGDKKNIILKDHEYENKIKDPDYTYHTINPLPGSLEEINQIEKCLSSKKIAPTILTGRYFNEQLFRATCQSKQLLHIATHGYYIPSSENGRYPADPMDRNALIMSGGASTLWFSKRFGPDDGLLTANEASSLNLNCARLIVLSSCESGKGTLDVDGVFGLQRGFKKAGAGSIIMSLWKVNDEACLILFDNFYQNLILKGMSVRDAFIFAQKALRKDSRFNTPYYWSSFILID